jgi:hypothetical protein
MVRSAIDFVNQCVNNSLQKPHTKSSTTGHFMNTTLLNKTRITPLMAQPFEVINVANDNTSGTQVVTKPPDKPRR